MTFMISYWTIHIFPSNICSEQLLLVHFKILHKKDFDFLQARQSLFLQNHHYSLINFIPYHPLEFDLDVLVAHEQWLVLYPRISNIRKTINFITSC